MRISSLCVATLFVLAPACRQSTQEAPAPNVRVQTPEAVVHVQGAPSTHPSVAAPSGAPGVTVQTDPQGHTQVVVQGPANAAAGQPSAAQPSAAQPLPAGNPVVVPPAPGALTPHPPVMCSGSESVVLTGVIIHNPLGPAITASGSCSVTLTNSTISGMIGVSASGSASITLTGGHVTGTATSIMATGSAEVTSTGTTVTGPTHHSGEATITQG